MELKTFEDGKKLLDDTPWDEDILVKDLSAEDKIAYLRFILSEPSIRNVSMLSNIMLLVRGSSLDEKDFEDDRVVFSTLEEYIDIKQEIKDDIKAYRDELAKYYLAALKSYAVVLPDGKEGVPASYMSVLCSMDILAVSKVLRNAKVDYAGLPLIQDAKIIIDSVNGRDPLFDDLIKQITKVVPDLTFE